jgi:hypothetical protein
MNLHHPTDNHPPTLLPLPLFNMANTSRDPFSLLPSSAPMKKKWGGQKKAAGVPAVAEAAASAGTLKKKTTSAKQKNNNPPELSDIKETPFDQLKGPPENIMPSLVPHTQQNAVRLTRNVLPQPPAHVYFRQLTVMTCLSPLLRQTFIFLLLTRIVTCVRRKIKSTTPRHGRANMRRRTSRQR